MPNFGYETIGGLSTDIRAHINGSVFTIGENGIADSISVAIWSEKEFQVFKCAIYRHSDLKLIGVTERRLDIPLKQLEFYVFNFSEPKPTLTANTEYILVVWSKFTSATVSASMDPGDINQGHWQMKHFNTFPDPLVPNHNDEKISIYCTYTPSEPPPKHTVTVKSTPIEGIPVTVNHEAVGTTPIPVLVDEGSHTIAVPDEVER